MLLNVYTGSFSAKLSIVCSLVAGLAANNRYREAHGAARYQAWAIKQYNLAPTLVRQACT